MNICGHNIADDQVIGIGPLMSKRKTDFAENLVQGFFKIYLRGYEVIIESDWLSVGDPDTRNEQELRAREEVELFKVNYYKIKKTIDKKVSTRNVRGVEIPVSEK